MNVAHVIDFGQYDTRPTKEGIDDLQNMLAGFQGLPMRTYHDFYGEWYLRQLWIPAGTLIVGRTHKQPHVCCITVGEVKVWDEDSVQVHTAPAYFSGRPGIRRVVLAHQLTCWINVHHNPTGTTDLTELEKHLVEPMPALPPPYTELRTLLEG